MVARLATGVASRDRQPAPPGPSALQPPEHAPRPTTSKSIALRPAPNAVASIPPAALPQPEPPEECNREVSTATTKRRAPERRASSTRISGIAIRNPARRRRIFVPPTRPAPTQRMPRSQTPSTAPARALSPAGNTRRVAGGDTDRLRTAPDCAEEQIRERTADSAAAPQNTTAGQPHKTRERPAATAFSRRHAILAPLTRKSQ